ncbi:hypothetical protein MUK42_06232 [Musa troglodytarum]|uniref:GH18 domain-containing protein n=1 Tax=Musa troglodytarum TaxID=320322 RepID=A0A9E7HU76_9LILI|nr:hypothetical protein MUK42_06232 [Musa troglodytarum]
MGQRAPSALLVSMLIFSFSPCSNGQQQCALLSGAGSAQVRAGYWFSLYSHDFPVSSIDAPLYTHLYYYSLSLSLDEANAGVSVLPHDQLPLLGIFSNSLKSSSPSLRTLLSIATDDHQANDSNAAFSAMAADPVLRAAFINSTLELARANRFDGLDLAWQFPSSPSDMTNLGILLEEWRARIGEEARNSSSALLLTATVYFSNHLFDEATDNLDYPTDAISRNLDWVNALCFGYHKNSNVTAHSAALFDKTSHFSTSYGITSWLDAGIPARKLVMGVPLQGRSWFLRNKAKNEAGDPVVAAGPRQKMSDRTGVMAYSEIEELMKDPRSGFVYDSQTVSSYLHSGDLWVSFDSPQVVEDKIRFAQHSTLLGYFLWPINFDDSNHTISKQASDAWLRNDDSSCYRDEDGFKQAPSPSAAPQEDAAAPSAAISGSAQRSAKTDTCHLALYLLPCFLFI